MPRVCIFEVDAVDVDRFFVDVLQLSECPELILVDEPDEYDKYKRSGRFGASNRVKCSAWMNVPTLVELLRTERIELLLLNASRIPDIHIILACRALDIRVSYIQHGMYVPFMKRSLSFFIRKAAKTLRYLYYAIDSGRTLRDWRVGLNLFRIHVLGANRNLMDAYPSIFPDTAAVISDYWKNWHLDYYRFRPSAFYVMGLPDFWKQQFSPEPVPQGIAYCYQTLVEDGRIDAGIMLAFYKDLLRWVKANGLALQVKGHPRMNPVFRDYFLEQKVPVEMATIPDTRWVIGHYSSLLPFWGARGRQVYCVRLPGHDIDPSFTSWTQIVDQVADIDLAPFDFSAECIRYFGSPEAGVGSLRTAVGLDA